MKSYLPVVRHSELLEVLNFPDISPTRNNLGVSNFGFYEALVISELVLNLCLFQFRVLHKDEGGFYFLFLLVM